MARVVLKIASFALSMVHGKQHPRVGAKNNLIDIDLRGNNDYNGPIYVGSEFRENHMIYDTASSWTILMKERAKGAEFPSNYDPNLSKTFSSVYKEGDTTSADPVEETVDLGS